MRKDKLGKLYDRLDPDERFRLGLKAAARGDEEDMKRLRDTCPRETYTANDTDFTDRISGSQAMTMRLFELLAPRLTKIRTLATFREALPYTFNHCINEARLAYLRGHERGASRAWEAAGKNGNPPIRLWKKAAQKDNALMEAELADLHTIEGHFREEIAAFLLDELEARKRLTASVALTVWRAFAKVCNEHLQLEPETLLGAWCKPLLFEIEELETLQDPPEVDLKIRQKYGKALVDLKILQKYEEVFKQVWEDMRSSQD
jgi:hypothetical protein